MTRKRKILIVLLPILTILMGFMPNAIRMRWQTSTEILYTYHAYASLLPTGYANFAPILTILLAGILLIVLLFWLYLEEGWPAVQVLSALASGMSICAFLVNLISADYFSAVGLIISILLAVQLVTVFITKHN